MSTDLEKYCSCMEEVRQRLALLDLLASKVVTTKVFDAEFAYLQFRKVLELVAFSSLIANKDIYSAAHAKFASHWKAKDMLEAIERLNPDFYPVPVGLPELKPDGTKLVTPLTNGYLTREEFAVLYDKSSDLIHTRNPFTTASPTLQMVHSGKEWLARIRKLITLHIVHLVDGRKLVVEVPGSGVVHVLVAKPR